MYLPSLDEIHEAWNLFLNLNIWLALVSMLMVAVTALALSVPLKDLGWGLYLPAFLVYFVYVRERRHIPEEDRVNHPYRTKLVEKYNDPLRTTEIIAFIGFQVLLVLELPPVLPNAIVIFVMAQIPIGVLYVYDLIKGNPSLDSLHVAGAWAYLIVFTVIISTNSRVGPNAVAVFLGWFLIVFAGVESRNISDIKGDEGVEHQTLAGVLGPRRTKRLEWFLKIVGLGIFWVLGGVKPAILGGFYLLTLRVARFLTNRSTYKTVQ